jgi:hypothetical protein
MQRKSVEIRPIPRYFVPVTAWDPASTHAFVEVYEWEGHVIHIDGRREVLECYRLDQAEDFVAQGHWREVSHSEARGWIHGRFSK